LNTEFRHTSLNASYHYLLTPCQFWERSSRRNTLFGGTKI